MQSNRPVKWVIGGITALAVGAICWLFAARRPPEVRPPEPWMADAMRIAEPLYKDVLSSEIVFIDAQLRAATAPRALPPLREIIVGLEKAASQNPEAKGPLAEFRMMAAAFGDSNSRAALEGSCAEPPPVGDTAKAYLLLVDWYLSDGKPDAQEQVLDRFEATMRQSPSQMLAAMLIRIYSWTASSDHAARIESVIANLPADLRGESERRLQAAKKLTGLVGKPLIISGKALDGSHFSSEDWKGKVILVDFWATWCGPCVQQLPTMKAVYAKYREQGLEVLGVSSDRDAATLRIIAERESVSWPQLFDAAAARAGQLHPAARELGIEGLPVMLLIDRNGVVRSVHAEADLENLIVGLLAELP